MKNLFAVQTKEYADTIAYEELADSPQMEFGQQFTATRTLKCAWDRAVELADALRGGPYSQLTYALQGGQMVVSGSMVVMYLPQPFPLRPQARVIRVRVEPFDNKPQAYDAEARVAKYEHAVLSVEYGIQDYSCVLDAQNRAIFTSEKLEPAAEFLSIPSTGLYWRDLPVGGGDPSYVPVIAEETPGRMLRMTTWQLTYHQCWQVPPELGDFYNTVNQQRLWSPRFFATFEPETLLFSTPTIDTQLGPRGERCFDVTLNLMWRPTGWNTFYRKGRALPEELWKTDVVGGAVVYSRYRPYSLADFDYLVPTV